TQSGEIPWVEEYRYLGVIFGRKNNRESRNKVEKLKGTALVSAHIRTLRSYFIPIYHKALVIKGIIVPSLLYGKEVGGCSGAAVKEGQRCLNRALRAAIGNGVALSAARKELGIPPLQALVAGAIARAGSRLKKKRTTIGKLLANPGKGKNTWTNLAARELKRMTKGAPMGTPKELETLVWRQEEGRCRAI
ncbi:MAG: uncharacterized protein A8A55_3506, partial [Amphiamblys sp. WSBS2006]